MDTTDTDYQQSSFRDPTKLTKWLTYFLYASIVADAVAVLSNTFQYQFLTEFRSGLYTSTEVAKAATEASDARQGIVGLFQLAISLPTIVLFCVWIRRSNSNARRLGATGMAFTPGWAIGWYFVPFANLWKPYQAMKEIWRASKNPASWNYEKVAPILPWWWFFFVLSELLSNASFRAGLKAREIDELIISTGIDLASDLFNIPAAITAILLIRQIYKMQIGHLRNGLTPILASSLPQTSG